MAGFENITLEKGMYAVSGKSFTQVLEELDHSSQYVGTPLEKLDAYQRQLKRYNIHVSGAGSDRVEKFFQNASTAALFPEYVARAVRQGMEQTSKLPQIVATTTHIDSLDYRTLSVTNEDDDDGGWTATLEAEEMPTTKILNQSGLVTLTKRGRMLVSSYEALRFQKLDLLTVMLRQIGAQLAATEMNEAVVTFLNGDGNTSGAEVTLLDAAPDYDDIVGLWGSLAPYRLNAILCGTNAMKNLLSQTEFHDYRTGMNNCPDGEILSPLGAKLIHVPGMEDYRVIGIDNTCALELVRVGDIMVEYDKLMDHQLERASVSTISGFSRIFEGAAHILDYTPEDDED